MEMQSICKQGLRNTWESKEHREVPIVILTITVANAILYLELILYFKYLSHCCYLNLPNKTL